MSRAAAQRVVGTGGGCEEVGGEAMSGIVDHWGFKVESLTLTGRSLSWRSGQWGWWQSGTPLPGSVGSPRGHSLCQMSLRSQGRHCCMGS